jgi:hypothetical protein
MTIVTVGIDLANNVFAVHGVNESGKVLPGATRSAASQTAGPHRLPASVPDRHGSLFSAHQRARECGQFGQFGHTIRLMAPKFAAPYRLSGNAARMTHPMPQSSQKPSRAPTCPFAPAQRGAGPGRFCCSFLARREPEDAVNRSDRRQPSPTNSLSHPIGGDHGNGTGRCRAVRIWVRAHQGATRPSVDVQPVPSLVAASNHEMQEHR